MLYSSNRNNSGGFNKAFYFLKSKKPFKIRYRFVHAYRALKQKCKLEPLGAAMILVIKKFRHEQISFLSPEDGVSGQGRS